MLIGGIVALDFGIQIFQRTWRPVKDFNSVFLENFASLEYQEFTDDKLILQRVYNNK